MIVDFWLQVAVGRRFCSHRATFGPGGSEAVTKCHVSGILSRKKWSRASERARSPLAVACGLGNCRENVRMRENLRRLSSYGCCRTNRMAAARWWCSSRWHLMTASLPQGQIGIDRARSLRQSNAAGMSKSPSKPALSRYASGRSVCAPGDRPFRSAVPFTFPSLRAGVFRFVFAHL